MRAQRLPDGRLVVRARADGQGAVGDGLVIVGPDHPDYTAWAERAVPAPEGLVEWARRRSDSAGAGS